MQKPVNPVSLKISWERKTEEEINSVDSCRSDKLKFSIIEYMKRVISHKELMVCMTIHIS